MNRQQKIGATIMGTIIMIAVIDTYYTEKKLSNKLESCSIYTIANVDRVYRQRFVPRIVYSYQVNYAKFEKHRSIGINTNKQDKSWFGDLDKLRNRRLLIRAYCADVEQHQILWDIIVPDSLQSIPSSGWKEPPAGLTYYIED